MVCGVGKMIENEFSVQTDYEWIDTVGQVEIQFLV